jgi:hypothetical protein
VSDSEICPNCGAYDETVFAAAAGQAPGCPTCGLSSEALHAIINAVRSGAPQDLVGSYREWVVRAWRAESDLQKLRGDF